MSNGRIVSQVVTEGNRRFDVVIRLSDTDRSTTGLAGLLVETPSGHVPLQLVAKIEETDGPNQILRENGERRIAVYANSDGTRDRAQIVSDIRDVLAATQWPQGYSATLEGTYQAYEEAAARIGVLSLASLLLIFLVLQSRYRSAVLALIIMVNIPLALDRQRRSALDRRIAAVGRQHDGLRHARRHQRAQRHFEDQPLHQSRGP